MTILRALLVLLVAACGAHRPTATSHPCGAWKSRPSAAPAARDSLVGVGVTDHTDDAIAAARQAALVALAEQVRVQVTSEVNTAAAMHRRGGVTRETESIEETSRVVAAAQLEGAEVLDSCTEGKYTYVLVGIQRARFADNGAARLGKLVAELASVETQAQAALAAARPLDAAVLLRQGAELARSLDELALLVRTVGGRDAPTTWPAPGDLERRGRNAAAQAAVVLSVDPPDAAALRDRALSCLGRAGIPVVEKSVSPDATIALQLSFEPGAEAAPGLHVVRATLTASLLRSNATVSAAADAAVKGAGADERSARTDAVRTLATQRLDAVLDRLLKSGGWNLRACAGQP